MIHAPLRESEPIEFPLKESKRGRGPDALHENPHTPYMYMYVGARIFFGIFFGFFWYFFWFCAVSGNLEAPLHHLWPCGSLQTTPGLPDDHFWPNHGSKTIFRAFRL